MDKLIEQVEVKEVVSALIYSQPFFASLLFDKMVLVYDESCPTAATDGKRIIIGKWFCKLPIKERLFVLCHEVAHAILLHCPRAKMYADTGVGPDFKPFNPKKWNIVGDWIINDMLGKSGIGTMPSCGLINTDVSFDDILDEVYAKAIDPPEDDDKGGSKPGDGSGGEGSGSSHGGFDEHMEASAPITEGEQADMERAIATAANAAKAQGKMPASLATVVDGILKPKITWQNVIRCEITNSLADEEVSWNKPNRRKQVFAEVTGLPQPVYPTMVGRGVGTVVVQCDTSGSIGVEEHMLMLGGIKDIVSDCRPETVYILWTDSRVAHVDELEDDIPNELQAIIDRLKVDGAPGGGGTRMNAGFEYCEEWGIQPDVMVTFTDGYTPWPESCQWQHVTACTVESKVGDCPFGVSVFCEVG